MTRRQATLLRAFCVWTVFVWVVFVRNIVRDDTHSAGFKVVHSVIAAISVAFAVAGWVVVRRVRRRDAGTPGVVEVEGGTAAVVPIGTAGAPGGPATAGGDPLEASAPRT